MKHSGPVGASSVAGPPGIEVTPNHVRKVADALRGLFHDDSGQDLIEYAMVAALVGLGVLGAVRGVKNSIGNTFNSVGNSLTNSVS
jgi:pilus assembly protein Flp/PilA